MFSQFSNSLAECSEIFQDIMCKIEICVVTAPKSAPLKMTKPGGLKKKKKKTWVKELSEGYL